MSVYNITNPITKTLVSAVYITIAAAASTAHSDVITFQEGVNPAVSYTMGATFLRSNEAGIAQDDDANDELIVGNFGTVLFNGLLEFDLTAIETASGGNPFIIDSVQLVMTKRAPVGGGSHIGYGSNMEVTVSSYDFDFDEATATWDNPGTGDLVDGGTIGTTLSTSSPFDPIPAIETDILFDNTLAFQTAVTTALSSDNNLRVILHATGGTPDTDGHLLVRFADETYGTLGARPELIVGYTVVPEPSSYALLGLASLAGLFYYRKKRPQLS